MDDARFDSLTRAWSAAGTRRGLLSLLGSIAIGGAEDAEAAGRRLRRKMRAPADGPCGNGSVQKNRCKRHGQCCTGYCHKKKRCRCKSRGQACTDDRNCCPKSTGRTCQSGSCQPQPPCAESCAGCCDGERCQPGNRPEACGVAGDRCQVCAENERCWNGACVCGDVCASGCRFTSLQEAINAASSGATLRLCAETYQGQIIIRKILTLIGKGDGEGGTVIVGGEDATEVVSIFNTPRVDLERLRITSGKNPSGAGGMFIGSLPAVTVSNCTISGNEGDIGGGIFNQGELTLMGSTVSNNTALRGGGGIHNSVIGTVALIECTVTGSKAGQWGGGIRNFGTVNLERSEVTNNSADDRGGGIDNGDSATLIAVNSAMAGNTAGNLGGGVFNTGAISLTDSSVTENKAGLTGGGIHSDPGTVTLTNSSVTGNTADDDGGGIFNNGATVTLTDSTVEDNTPDNCAGGPVVGCSG